MKKEPKRRKTESTSTGAFSSRPKEHQESEPVPMDDDCLPADDDNAPRNDGNARRSVAGTLGQRRFQRAPGPLSFDETQQLDQTVAADALDNVLDLLQRKTREAYVVPWYKREVDGTDFRVSRHGDGADPVAAHSMRECRGAMVRRRRLCVSLGFPVAEACWREEDVTLFSTVEKRRWGRATLISNP